MPTTNAPRRRAVAPPLLLLLLGAVAPGPLGCGAPTHPADGSPIVAPDSEAARKATAEAEDLIRLRQKQEKASHRRAFVAPEA